MKKLISILVAAMFAAVALNAVADDKGGKEPTKKTAKAKKDTAKPAGGAMDKDKDKAKGK